MSTDEPGVSENQVKNALQVSDCEMKSTKDKNRSNVSRQRSIKGFAKPSLIKTLKRVRPMVNDRGEGSSDVIEKIKFFELKVESRKLMCQTGSSPRKVRILSIADSNSD